MRGIAIPAIPAKRIDAMAMNLRTNAAGSSRHRSDSAPPHVEFVIDSLSLMNDSFSMK